MSKAKRLSKRLTIKLILADGRVVKKHIHAQPGHGFTDANIDAMLEQAAIWIEEKYKFNEFRMVQVGPKEFNFVYAGLKEFQFNGRQTISSTVAEAGPPQTVPDSDSVRS